MDVLTASVPMKWVGPLKFMGDVVNAEQSVPLATYETPLWPSVGRGALISRLCDGILATVVDERMTRSILLEAKNAQEVFRARGKIEKLRSEIELIVASSSNFAKLIDWHFQHASNLLFIRLEFFTGDASGHNMATNAADKIIAFILSRVNDLKYISVSGNFCSDKKATAVNGILGRGKNVIVEMLIPREVCERRLRTTPELMVELNIKKNLIGTMLAGGLRSANAHYANMLLAFYLATGQDAANIIEGSQGITHAAVEGDNLYFSCNLPNLIMGSVGNGKGLDFVENNLRLLGCKQEDVQPGDNARRLAVLCAGAVLCGELSLMAAQTNYGELMGSHLRLERNKK